MKEHLRLGASLYVPATRPDLAAIAAGTRLGSLKSVIFCTEDAVALDEVEVAIENVAAALAAMGPSDTLRFVRVRNASVMARVLALPHVERLDGFVLPKITRASFAAYAELLARRDRFRLLPTLETAEVFNPREMRRLREYLLRHPLREQVLALRIGGNDLLNLLHLRRAPQATIYETPLAAVIASLITTFHPAGLPLTAPVFDRLDDAATLAREARLDVQQGLLSKSAVHPAQVAVIQAQYAVSNKELELAQSILSPGAAPVFQLHGCFCEPATHDRWAHTIVDRHRLYGVATANV